jgi:hypothetical protein
VPFLALVLLALEPLSPRAQPRDVPPRSSPRSPREQAVLRTLFGEELPELLDVFKALDKDGSGSVTWDEFVEHIESAFRPIIPIAHRERLKKRAPPPFEAPSAAVPPPAI